MIFLVSASAFLLGSSGSVWVVSVGHGALVANEVPSIAHPATLASICAVVLAESPLVFGVSGQCAVNDLLFGEADWFSLLLDSDGTLESSRGTKGPAGTAGSLVLNGAHLAIESPIDIDSFVRLQSEESADVAEGSAGRLGEIFAHLKAVNSVILHIVLVETEKAKVLILSEIGSPVVGKNESIGIVFVALGVLCFDDPVIALIDSLSEGEFSGICVTLVVCALELDEACVSNEVSSNEVLGHSESGESCKCERLFHLYSCF